MGAYVGPLVTAFEDEEDDEKGEEDNAQ